MVRLEITLTREYRTARHVEDIDQQLLDAIGIEAIAARIANDLLCKITEAELKRINSMFISCAFDVARNDIPSGISEMLDRIQNDTDSSTQSLWDN